MSRGLVEETIAMVTDPQAVVSEGLAELSLDLMLDGAAGPSFQAVVRDHGIELDLARDRAVQRAAEPLGWLGVDGALMLHADGGRTGRGERVPQREGPHRPGRRGALGALPGRPRLARYAICYPAGLALCRDFVAGGPGPVPPAAHRAGQGQRARRARFVGTLQFSPREIRARRT